MKEVSMFDVSNPLDEEQCMEVDGGACYCSCRGSSSTSDNRSANQSGGLMSCSCWPGSGPITSAHRAARSSGSTVYC